MYGDTYYATLDARQDGLPLSLFLEHSFYEKRLTPLHGRDHH